MYLGLLEEVFLGGSGGNGYFILSVGGGNLFYPNITTFIGGLYFFPYLI